MNNVKLTFAMGFEGVCTGTSTSATLEATLPRTVIQHLLTSTGKQVLDKGSATFTVGAGATTTIDLTSGQVNPLGESISGAMDFVKVFVFWVHHEFTSISSNIEVFGGVSANLFQGPLNATGKLTLAPGMGAGFMCETANTTGWAVSATVKNIDIKNLDVSDPATVRLFVSGAV